MSKSKCDDCGGACCQNVAILVGKMTQDQIAWAEMRGTVETNQRGVSLWRLPVRCRKLDYRGRCMIYQDRPNVCREFEAGGERCKAARAAEGLRP